jgi:hypothetical protein
MQTILKTLVLMLAAYGSNAWADRGDQYVLGKLGFMSVKKNNAETLGSIGALYGYGLTPAITLESEINLGLFGGKYEQKNPNDPIPYEKGNYRIWTVAGYGVYRFLFSDVTYLKGKLGLLYENVIRSSGKLKLGDDIAKGFGLAGGVGLGTRIADALTLEGEITGIDKDIVFFSLGLHYAFK